MLFLKQYSLDKNIANSIINTVAAIIGMITGALTVIMWEIFNPFGLYSLVPGFIISSLVIFVVSLFTQKKNEKVEQLFTELESKFWTEVKAR